MILDLTYFGDPILRAKGRKVDVVDDPIRQLAADMIETMYAANGVGLAAQQVGVPLQLTVLDITGITDRPSAMAIDGRPVNPEDHMPLVLLNPELDLGTERDVAEEGCLSFPEITGDITRAAHVHVRALTLAATPLEFDASGLLARALQHEADHLHGVLFIDRMNSATRAGLAGKLKRLKREAGY